MIGKIIFKQTDRAIFDSPIDLAIPKRVRINNIVVALTANEEKEKPSIYTLISHAVKNGLLPRNCLAPVRITYFSPYLVQEECKVDPSFNAYDPDIDRFEVIGIST